MLYQQAIKKGVRFGFDLPLSAYPIQRGETRAPVQAMWKMARWYCQQGLMAGTIFREVLIDLQREGLSGDARQIEGMLWEGTLILSKMQVASRADTAAHMPEIACAHGIALTIPCCQTGM